ncbi:MAG: hypothetical protein H6686_06885 [Fibrobacteria bacterium]|nr:hypothetical protein [Fibrobacteria bacterium]
MVIGRTREGREIEGVVVGRGPLVVSLVAGCHGDEPVGPSWLGAFARALEGDPRHPLRDRATFRIVPDANPDAAEANRSWWRGGDGAGDLPGYLSHRSRELPGDDLEFGFPGRPEGDDGIRPEALAIAGFLEEGGPVHVHGSLHGLGFGGGPWFLVEPSWTDRIGPYHRRCLEGARREGLRPHDVDRKGEKGFVRLGEGLCSRPDSRAMREHFQRRGDSRTAGLFRPSSMEFVRSLGGDPFTFVTEVPLFVLPDPGHPKWPDRLVGWSALLRRSQRPGSAVDAGELVRNQAREEGVVALDLDRQKRLIADQVLGAIDLAESWFHPSPS